MLYEVGMDYASLMHENSVCRTKVVTKMFDSAQDLHPVYLIPHDIDEHVM